MLAKAPLSKSPLACLLLTSLTGTLQACDTKTYPTLQSRTFTHDLLPAQMICHVSDVGRRTGLRVDYSGYDQPNGQFGPVFRMFGEGFELIIVPQDNPDRYALTSHVVSAQDLSRTRLGETFVAVHHLLRLAPSEDCAKKTDLSEYLQ